MSNLATRKKSQPTGGENLREYVLIIVSSVLFSIYIYFY